MDQTPSQNCAGGLATADGIAKVIDVLPNGKNYDYRWFDGNSTAGTPGPTTLNTTITTNNYANVQGGLNGISLFEYTVEVTIKQSGCVNTATIGVDNDGQLPIVTLTPPVDNTNCSATKNGSVAISTVSYRGNPVASPYAGFTFTWAAGGTVGPAPGDTYTKLPAGTYTVTATNTADLCTSNPVQVTIADNLFLPPVDVVDVDQTSCDPLTPNGSLTATIDETAIGGATGVTAGYAFTWVDDVTLGSTNSNQILNLKGDQTYTITAVRNLTGCTTVQSIYLNETITTPVVSVNVTDMTTCVPPNGSLSATVLPVSTYDFFWYNDNDAIDENAVITNAATNGFIDLNKAASLYSGLAFGEYTVVARDIVTKCISQQLIKAVADASPPINPVAANTVIPVDCAVAGGTLDGGIQLTSTNFTALAATDQLTTTAPLGLAVNDVIYIERNGVLALPNGIEDQKAYFIKTIAGNLVTLSLTAGGATIDLTTDGDGTIGDFKTAGYSYEWYAGVPTASNPVLGSINYFTNPPVYSAAALSNTSTLAGIATGLYTLQVTNTLTGCKAYLPHTLPFIGAHAVLKINKTNSTLCPYTIGDGSIEIEIEDPAAAPPAIDQNDYLVALYQGIVSGPTTVVAPFVPVPPVAPFFITNTLAPGSYIVEVPRNLFRI